MRDQIDRLRKIADTASDPEVRDTLRDIAEQLSSEHAFIESEYDEERPAAMRRAGRG